MSKIPSLRILLVRRLRVIHFFSGDDEAIKKDVKKNHTTIVLRGI